MNILLIDDSRTMRNIQKMVLAELGETTFEEAQDGRDALTKLASFTPDLILCDWNMPTMDGLTFVKAFRLTNQTTPIIMVTTESDKSKVIEAIKAGVNNYVVKPFTPDLLTQRVHETLDQRPLAA